MGPPMNEEADMETIRYSKDASICIVHNSKTGEYSCPTQDDMDTLPVGPDLTDEEILLLDS